MSEKSCLVRHFAHYLDLSADDEAYLGSLEKIEYAFERGDDVYRAGDDASSLHVVKSGWLYSHVTLNDGRRQITTVHHAGDVVGFPDVAFRRATTSLRAVEPAVVCPFPRLALRRAFVSFPQVGALLFTLALRDQVRLVDTIRALGRMSARERLMYFVLDLLARQRVTGEKDGATIRLPMNQFEIGDLLGITNVHVSRELSSLEADGFITRKGARVDVLREAAMTQAVGFVDRYVSVDISWFPGR